MMKKNTPLRAAFRTALTMLVFAALGTALLAYVFELTRPTIAKSEEAAKLSLVAQVLPANLFDNDILQDTLSLPASTMLGQTADSLVYRARLQGKPAAVVLEVVAPDGYSGKINLLVGISAQGAVTGVRVVAHKETPGLGDYIEIVKSAWIKAFDGGSINPAAPEKWAVKKDGGQFEYRAGATITPRAVVKAVKQALQYYEQNKMQLFAAVPSR